MEGLLRQHVEVAPQQRVARDHHVRRGDLLEQVAAPRAVQDQALEVGREARELLLPVEDDRGGRDQQRRPLVPGCLLAQQEGDRLDRLAQAHVVGEDAVEAVVGQEAQVIEAPALVLAQLADEGLGHAHLGDPREVAQ
ncbi:hypothetical protein D3C87_1428870 [compost metagenome]